MAGGRLLATATFTRETPQAAKATFGSPVQITAGTVYVVSYYVSQGHYSFNGGYFNSGVASQPRSDQETALMFPLVIVREDDCELWQLAAEKSLASTPLVRKAAAVGPIKE